MRKKLNLFMVIVLSLLLSGCVISGTITDGDGIIIEGVEVMISGNEGNFTTQTDADGKYAFGHLLPGKYTITVSSEDYTFTPATVSANKATTRVDFEGENDCEDDCIDSYNYDIATCISDKAVAEGVCQDEYYACNTPSESPGCDGPYFACMDEAEFADVACQESAMEVRDDCITTNCDL